MQYGFVALYRFEFWVQTMFRLALSLLISATSFLQPEQQRGVIVTLPPGLRLGSSRPTRGRFLEVIDLLSPLETETRDGKPEGRCVRYM